MTSLAATRIFDRVVCSVNDSEAGIVAGHEARSSVLVVRGRG